MSIKISVVIPVYNVEKYIMTCIDSLLNQTFKDIEIILVDDGSPDNSGKILDEYEKNDSRIKVIHKKNAGVSAARNDGLRICQGEYVYIMDSDDYLDEKALETMYEQAKKTDADVVITDHYTFVKENEYRYAKLFSQAFVTEDKSIIQKIQEMVLHMTYSPYYISQYKGLGIAPPWTKLVKRELIVNNNFLFDSYVQGIFDDGLFSLHVFQFAKKVSYIEKPLYYYRILESSLIHKYNPNRAEINNKVFERIEKFGKEFKKDECFYEAYYARMILYMNTICEVLFFNKNNENSFLKNYKLFKETFSTTKYRKAFSKVDTKRIKSRKRKIMINLLRLNFYLMTYIIAKYIFYREV